MLWMFWKYDVFTPLQPHLVVINYTPFSNEHLSSSSYLMPKQRSLFFAFLIETIGHVSNMYLVCGGLHSTNGSWLMSVPNGVPAPYPVSCTSEVSGPCQTLPIWTMPVGRCSSCSWRGSSLARRSCEDISQPCPQGWCESLLEPLKVFIHKIKMPKYTVAVWGECLVDYHPVLF